MSHQLIFTDASVPLLLTSYLSSSFPETPASRQLGITLVSDALQS